MFTFTCIYDAIHTMIPCQNEDMCAVLNDFSYGTQGLSQDFRICCGSMGTGEDFFQTDLMGQSIFNLLMYNTTAFTRCWDGIGWDSNENQKT